MALFFIYVHCFPKHRWVWCQEFSYGPAVSHHTLLVSKDTLQRQSLSNLLAISSGVCTSISHHVLILLSLDLSFFFFHQTKLSHLIASQKEVKDTDRHTKTIQQPTR